MKNKLKKLFQKVSTASILSLATVSTVYAQDIIQVGDAPSAASQSGDLRSVINSFVNYFLSFLGLLAVMMIIYAGILMVSSAGDEEQSKKGKTIILWAVIGIVIILLSYTIVSWVAMSGKSAG